MRGEEAHRTIVFGASVLILAYSVLVPALAGSLCPPPTKNVAPPCPLALLPQPTALMDEVHVCVLRALAADETPAERAEHALDISLLDAMTWPQYVWELLRLTGGGGGQISCGQWGLGSREVVAQ